MASHMRVVEVGNEAENQREVVDFCRVVVKGG